MLLTPVAAPPHKEAEQDPGPEARLELCRLAIAGDERLGVCDLEVRRGGPSYTVDTLRELHARTPEDDLTFIVGGDIALGLPSWHEPEAVLGLARLAVAERSGAGREEIVSRLDAAFRSGGAQTGVLRHAAAGHLVLADPAPCRAGGTDSLSRTRSRCRADRSGKALSMNPDQLAETIAAQAADKKAIDVVELDVRGVVGYTDFFLVCSGNTSRQVKAIHDGIHQALKDEHGILPRRVEGQTEATWILMDYLDVVVHIFTPEARDFYRLEQLWGEVPARAMEPAEA